MESDPYLSVFPIFSEIIIRPFQFGDFLGFISIAILLFASACFSGAEIALFSLSPSELNSLNTINNKNSKQILGLLDKPERLLATILIANNFVNVGIVIISSYLSNSIINFNDHHTLGFVFQILIVTFLILLFGEILPKVYSSYFSLRFASFIALPITILVKILKPISTMIIRSTSIVDKRIASRKGNLSLNDLSDALVITENNISEDKKILKGIVKFSNIEAKEIMTPRMDMIAVEYDLTFRELLIKIVEAGFSRIPVYEENLDNIKGILYIKDLLPYLDENDSFNWQKLIRLTYFVPERKRINDLLEEFQNMKNHLAIVIDEFGGTQGIITLEDILEEIVGEITDELDEIHSLYKKLDNNQLQFDGKVSLMDFSKVFELSDEYFDLAKGDSETLAGLILELLERIPLANEKVRYKEFEFTIKSVDNRRIKEIIVKFEKLLKTE